MYIYTNYSVHYCINLYLFTNLYSNLIFSFNYKL